MSKFQQLLLAQSASEPPLHIPYSFTFTAGTNGVGSIGCRADNVTPSFEYGELVSSDVLIGDGWLWIEKRTNGFLGFGARTGSTTVPDFFNYGTSIYIVELDITLTRGDIDDGNGADWYVGWTGSGVTFVDGNTYTVQVE